MFYSRVTGSAYLVSTGTTVYRVYIYNTLACVFNGATLFKVGTPAGITVKH